MAIDTYPAAGGRNAAAASGGRGLRLRPRKITARDRMFLLEQLTLLLDTGASLHGALQSVRKELEHPELARVLDAVLEDIETGKGFSGALARHPEAFSTTYVNLIAASENGGFLPQVLNQLRQMEEKREKLRGTIVSAAAYPVLLSIFSAAVVVFVLVVVFPKFGAIFARIEDELPASTKALMWCSDFLRAYWLQTCAVTAGLAALARRWTRSEQGREWLDAAKLNAPLVRHLCVQVYLVQALRAMSLSLANGVSAIDTLAACRDVVDNRVFQRFIEDVRAHVERGGNLAAGFERAEFLPSIVRQLIATADASGSLPKVCARLAEYYENELEKRLALLARIAEPVMLAVMGVLVGVLVSSLILPIFKLSHAVD